MIATFGGNARTMAKRKEGTNSMSVRLDNDVIESGRVVASLVGRTLNDLFSEILRERLKTMEAAELAKRLDAVRAEAKKPSKGKE